MEDFIQIIFILIFIVSSIISSMNKKKKKQQAIKDSKQTPKPAALSNKKPQVKQKQKSSAEILEEILGFKVEVPEPQKKEAPISYSEENVNSSWDPESEFAEVAKPKVAESYEEKISKKKLELLEDKKKHSASKKSDIFSKPETKKRVNTKQKLFAKKSSLKDYILIQEILNKPKSLRK